MKYKAGDVREDGKVFIGYNKRCKNGEYWSSIEKLTEKREKSRIRVGELYGTKEGQIKQIANTRKRDARKSNLPFDVSVQYLMDITTETCPVLGIKLSWGERKGRPTDNSPSLDKIKPELGYVVGNVVWMSHKANTMKSNASFEQIQALANWMKAQA